MRKTMNAKTDKRQTIISAAVFLFRHTHNVKKVSLETIAQEAGVSPTTIYNLFGTREKLVFEVIKVLAKENIDHNRKLVRSSLPFPKKLFGIISGKVDLASELNNEILTKIVTQDATVAPLIDALYETEIRPLWFAILADGKKQGYIDKKLDENALFIYLDIVKAGLSARKDLAQSLTDNPTLIEQITRIFYNGVLKKDIDLFTREDN